MKRQNNVYKIFDYLRNQFSPVTTQLMQFECFHWGNKIKRKDAHEMHDKANNRKLNLIRDRLRVFNVFV